MALADLYSGPLYLGGNPDGDAADYFRKAGTLKPPTVLGRPAPSPVNATAPNMPAPTLGASTMLGGAPSTPQVRNPLQDQAPQPLTGKRKALAAIFAGMGAFKSPELGQQIYNEEFVAPQQRYQKQQEQQQADIARQREAASRESLQGAQTQEALARANALNNPAAKDVKQDWRPVTGTNWEINSATGETRQMQGVPTPTAKEGTPPHITVMVKGQPHIMERDPKTGDYSIDRGIAPPTYAGIAPSLKTVDVIDPVTGLPTVKTLAGQTLGVSGTGAYGHEAAQAGAVTRAGNDLISDIQANKNQLGTLTAWVKKYGLNTPIADPNLARLQAELGTFAALQPAMHGFRSHSAMETFEKIVGGLQKNPDATIASIQGILKTAGAINPALGGPNVGDIENGFRFNGGNPSDPKNWTKVKTR